MMERKFVDEQENTSEKSAWLVVLWTTVNMLCFSKMYLFDFCYNNQQNSSLSIGNIIVRYGTATAI